MSIPPLSEVLQQPKHQANEQKEISPPQNPTLWMKLYFLGLFLLACAIFTGKNVADADLWGVMSMGAWLDQHQVFWQHPEQFPFTDPFSYTAFGQPWIYHEWGSGVLFYQVLKQFGDTGLLVFKILLGTATLLISYRIVKLNNSPFSLNRLYLYCLVLPIGLYILFSAYAATIRCHSFSILFYATFLLILESVRLKRKTQYLWLLPFITILWVNLHGGFILGFFLLGLYGLWFFWDKHPALQKTLIAFGLCAIATLINPYGLALHQELFSAWSLPRKHISEWQSVFFFGKEIGITFTTWVGLFVITHTLNLIPQYKNADLKNLKTFSDWQKLPFPGHWLLLLATGIEGILKSKLTPFLVITTLSIGLATNLSWLMRKQPEPPQWAEALFRMVFSMIATGVLLLSAAFINTQYHFHPESLHARVPSDFPPKIAGQPEPKDAITYPIYATRYIIEQQLKGNLWVPFDWGEYVYWRLYPNVKIACDGRYETIYKDNICEDLMDVSVKPYPIEKFDRFEKQTNLVMLMQRHPVLIQKFKTRYPNWRELYQDQFVLLLGKPGQGIPDDLRPFRNTTPLKDTLLKDEIGDLTRFGKP